MDRGVDRLQDIGDAADVVLMPVGDEEAAQLLLVVDEIGDVGDHKIHAVHIVLGKAQAAVDHDHVLAVLEHGHILSDFIQSAQRNNFQFFCQFV